MNILLAILLSVISVSVNVTVQPDPMVAGAEAEITCSGDTAGKFLSIATPMGKFYKRFDLSATGNTVKFTVPIDAHVLLIAVKDASQLEVPYTIHQVYKSPDELQKRALFWQAYLKGSFPTAFPVDDINIEESITIAKKAIETNPEDYLSYDLLWRLQAQAAENVEAQKSLLQSIDAKIDESSHARLILAAVNVHKMLGDMAGANELEAKYKGKLAPLQQTIDMRWNRIQSTGRPQNRINLIHQWLADDPLNIHGPMCIQLLGPSYMATGQYYQTALYGVVSLKVMPEDAMTLNGVAYAMAEGNFEVERGLVFADKAISILTNPKALRKPETLNETQWKRVLDDAKASALDTKAWLLYQLQRYDEAVKVLDQALLLMEKDEFYLHYGRILKQQGKIAEARKMFERGHRLFGPKRLEIENEMNTLH